MPKKDLLQEVWVAVMTPAPTEPIRVSVPSTCHQFTPADTIHAAEETKTQLQNVDTSQGLAEATRLITNLIRRQKVNSGEHYESNTSSSQKLPCSTIDIYISSLVK
jgi:hypothetical protein